MTIPMGGGKLNLSPCTPDDELQNLQVINKKFTQIDQVIEAGGVPDHKVSVSGADEGLGGADYLFAKIQDTGSFNSDTDAVVSAADTGATVSLFWSATNMVGYQPDKLLNLIVDNGVLKLAEFTDTVDNYTAKITADDLTASFFHDCIYNPTDEAIVGGADLTVIGEVIGAAASDQTEHFAVDVSAIAGFHLTEFRVWTTESNVTTLISAAAFGDAFFGGITIDGGSYSGGVLTISGGGGGGSGSAKIGKADSAIPARSGNTMGSGTVSVWSASGATLSDSGSNETWYNAAKQSIVAGEFIMAKQIGSVMVIDYEDCDA